MGKVVVEWIGTHAEYDKHDFNNGTPRFKP